jgi:AcrR family transcriptional regulator
MTDAATTIPLNEPAANPDTTQKFIGVPQPSLATLYGLEYRWGPTDHRAPNMDVTGKLSTPLRRPKGRKIPLGRDAWLKAARSALIHEGIGGVEIGKLARRLRATRGGFYWFFTSRKQLLDNLLTDWEETNTAAFESIVRARGANGTAEFQALCDMWVDESDYDPQWDAAVREWARISPRVATVVRRIDDVRIEIIRRIFHDMGYEEPEAFIRARITYFHQVGYYALGVHESREQRLKLLPLYVRILTGRAL